VDRHRAPAERLAVPPEVGPLQIPVATWRQSRPGQGTKSTPALRNRCAALGMCQAEVTRATRLPAAMRAKANDSSSVSRAVSIRTIRPGLTPSDSAAVGKDGGVRRLSRFRGAAHDQPGIRQGPQDPDGLDDPREAGGRQLARRRDAGHVAMPAPEHPHEPAARQGGRRRPSRGDLGNRRELVLKGPQEPGADKLVREQRKEHRAGERHQAPEPGPPRQAHQGPPAGEKQQAKRQRHQPERDELLQPEHARFSSEASIGRRWRQTRGCASIPGGRDRASSTRSRGSRGRRRASASGARRSCAC
jgi:hypothetical protein